LNEVIINYVKGEIIATTQTFGEPETISVLKKENTGTSNTDNQTESSNFSDRSNGSLTLCQQESLFPNRTAKVTELEKVATESLLLAAALNFVQATEWLMYLVQKFF